MLPVGGGVDGSVLMAQWTDSVCCHNGEECANE